MKTAVEWLIDELTNDPKKYLFLCDKPDYMDELVKIIEQAKNIEKQQIKNAYDISKENYCSDGEEYYNYLINDFSE